MGGGNAQKSKTARERNLEKNKASKGSQLEANKKAMNIQKDPYKALRMTTKQTLMDVWRDGGMKGLFAGVGPRVARAGPSVGIVVSFYEVVKYVLHHNV